MAVALAIELLVILLVSIAVSWLVPRKGTIAWRVFVPFPYGVLAWVLCVPPTEFAEPWGTAGVLAYVCAALVALSLHAGVMAITGPRRPSSRSKPPQEPHKND